MLEMSLSGISKLKMQGDTENVTFDVCVFMYRLCHNNAREITKEKSLSHTEQKLDSALAIFNQEWKSIDSDLDQVSKLFRSFRK